MQKTMLVIAAAFLLTGCGLMPWLGAHQAEIAIVGVTAGATGAVLGAADNAVRLQRDVRDEMQRQ